MKDLIAVSSVDASIDLELDPRVVDVVLGNVGGEVEVEVIGEEVDVSEESVSNFTDFSDLVSFWPFVCQHSQGREQLLLAEKLAKP